MDKSPPRELRRAMGKPNATREEAREYLQDRVDGWLNYANLASELGVTTVTLYRWRKDLGVERSW